MLIVGLYGLLRVVVLFVKILFVLVKNLGEMFFIEVELGVLF